VAYGFGSIGPFWMPENRRYAERIMAAINRAIARDSFDYAAQFPRGIHRHLFDPEAKLIPGTFRDFIVKWQTQRSPFLPGGQVMDRPVIHPTTFIHDESVIKKYLLPTFGL
jgi:hypothetical protein